MTTRNRVEALVLKKRETIISDMKPSGQIMYDTHLQIWVNNDNRKPVVSNSAQSKSRNTLASDFGETQLTKTSEGVDQSEIISCSDFGETLITETREGADQSEIIGCSDFGETTFTKTREGSDQPELIQCSDFGETRLTATREGVDQSESSDFLIDREDFLAEARRL